MEPKPTINNTSNSVSHEVFNDHLEKVVQDFTKFKGRMSETACTGAMKLEDLIDMYIDSGGVNENSPVDLNETESAPLPHGFNIDREIQESDIMINGMSESEDTSQNDTGNFPDSSPTGNTNSQLGPGDSNCRVTHITYGDLNCPGVADHIIGSALGCSAETVFRSVMKSLKKTGAGEKENGDGTTSRTSIKRKYNQIIGTEEETAWRMGITTIKISGESAKSRAEKQAHGTHLRSQQLRLREKNEQLRRSVIFLESHKRTSLSPEPLRGTISHPQQISSMDKSHNFL